MTIYVSHSKNFDYKNELYYPLKSLVEKYDFVFPHEDSEKSYPTKKLFQEKKCDLVIAEVSYPATGQGIELGWADILNIPILCVHKKGKSISGSIKLISKEVFEYSNGHELLEIVKSHAVIK